MGASVASSACCKKAAELSVACRAATAELEASNEEEKGTGAETEEGASLESSFASLQYRTRKRDAGKESSCRREGMLNSFPAFFDYDYL
mmetsp:Transcript_52438/g.102630  ORF Transcript_52438/g.102630 Transcript_52438/m.102630 type:complete len:89 (+) Transcript_52438:608-874(+)